MTIFKLLSDHKDLFFDNNYWTFDGEKIQIGKENNNYLKISEKNISLFNVDILSKMISNNKDSHNEFDPYFSFINEIKDHIKKLNHIGFGYKVINTEAELTNFKNNLPDDFQIVEEDSGDKVNNRWFFIRHKTDRLMPKIELVLYETDKYEYYCPQFQIDIDTDLSYESIRKISDRILGGDFFSWAYDIPNYGVVMAMGKIGQINGVKIFLGIGSNLRRQPEADFKQI